MESTAQGNWYVQYALSDVEWLWTKLVSERALLFHSKDDLLCPAFSVLNVVLNTFCIPWSRRQCSSSTAAS